MSKTYGKPKCNTFIWTYVNLWLNLWSMYDNTYTCRKSYTTQRVQQYVDIDKLRVSLIIRYFIFHFCQWDNPLPSFLVAHYFEFQLHYTENFASLLVIYGITMYMIWWWKGSISYGYIIISIGDMYLYASTSCRQLNGSTCFIVYLVSKLRHIFIKRYPGRTHFVLLAVWIDFLSWLHKHNQIQGPLCFKTLKFLKFKSLWPM